MTAPGAPVPGATVPGRPLAVIALGGNALVPDADHVSIPDQYETLQAIAPALVDVAEAGWDLVLTHGNGPQVGFILRRSELALAEVAPVPIDYAVGDTQGAIGYMFLKALGNELRRRGLERPVTALVTQTVVAAEDPAFARPTKPVGAFLDQEVAERMAATVGWDVTEDAGRGWRRVVASPRPVEIVEAPTIAELARRGVIVVACGGGGIAVTRAGDGALHGVEAVVDKDHASALLAAGLGADVLAIATGVERAAVGFGTSQQRWLDELRPVEAAELLAAGQFAEGSMKPKIEALLGFIEAQPAGAGLLTTPQRLIDALAGRAGTRIVGAALAIRRDGSSP